MANSIKPPLQRPPYILLLLPLLLTALTALTSCSRKTYQSVSRTTDTLTLTHTDTLAHTDTIHTQTNQSLPAHTDSTTHREQTILLLDSTGKVILQAIYRDHTQTHINHHTIALATAHTTTAHTTTAHTTQAQTQSIATTQQTKHNTPQPLRPLLLTALFLLIALTLLIVIIRRLK